MTFLLTPELGRLAKWLRAGGYDAAVDEGKIPDLLAKATFEKRTILTRQKHLSGHRGTPVICIQSDQVEEQLRELKRLLKIGSLRRRLFTRCLLCNVPVKPVARERIKGKVPPYVFRTQRNFSHCPICRRIYWAATHWDRAKGFLRKAERRD